MDVGMTVRLAEVEDIPTLVAMGKKFHAITDYQFIPYDEATAENLMLTAIDHGLCAVCCKEGKIIGMLVGMKAPCILNQNIMIGTELAWWIEPEYRGSSAAIRLLDFIEQQAKNMGLAFWSMMCLETSKPDGLESLYLKRSYVKAERTFVRVL